MVAILQFIPVIVLFYFAGIKHDNYAAAYWLVISSLICYGLIFVKQKFTLDKKQIGLFLVTVVLSGITYLLHDDLFIRLKAPLVFTIQALAFALSPLFGGEQKTTLAERLFKTVFDLTAAQWRQLNWGWVVLSLLLAASNALVAFTWPEYWVHFKMFGSMGISIVFMVGMFVVYKAHLKEQPDTTNKQ